MLVERLRRNFARVHRLDGGGYVPQTRCFACEQLKRHAALAAIACFAPVLVLAVRGWVRPLEGLASALIGFVLALAGIAGYMVASTRHRRGDPFRFSDRQFLFFRMPSDRADAVSPLLLRAGFDSLAVERVPEGEQEILAGPLREDPSAFMGIDPDVRLIVRVLRVDAGEASHLTLELFSWPHRYSNAVHAAAVRIGGLPELAPHRVELDPRIGR